MTSLTDLAEHTQVAYGNDSELAPPVIYHFYHIPKCGGMDFYASLEQVIHHWGIQNKRMAFFGRADTFKDLEEMASLLVESGATASDMNKMIGIFATHLGEPAFKRMFPDTVSSRKITFIREPYSRLLSLYSYQQMRKGFTVTKNGFKEFIRNPLNCNGIAKSLFPDTTDIGSIIGRLKTFYICTTLDRQNIFLQQILYQHGLYNVVRGGINLTLNKYRMDHLKDDGDLRSIFNDRNRLDREIWQEVNRNPIEPVISNISHMASKTMLLIPNQSETELRLRSEILDTKDLISLLPNESTQKFKSLGELTKRIYS